LKEYAKAEHAGCFFEEQHYVLLCFGIVFWRFYPASSSFSCTTKGYRMADCTVLFSWLAQAVRLLNTNVNLHYVQQMVLNR
jgi:hypothetical protein